MARYVTNDLAFEVDEDFTDLSIHELNAPLAGASQRLLGVLIEREPLPPATPFADAVRARLSADGRRLPRHEIGELRELRVAGAEAVAVMVTWVHGGVRHYGRQLHVLAGASRLTFSVAAPEDHRDVCDQYFDHLIETLKLDA